MPANELTSAQLPAGTASGLLSQLQNIAATLIPYTQNITPEERQRFGSINEQNKLLVNKVWDYRQQQPTLSSPDISWPTFEQHQTSRNGLASLEQLCASIIEMCSDTRILHDYSLYQNALADYDYAKYRAGSTPGGGGFHTKVEEIKQFFPNPGGNSTPPPQPGTEDNTPNG